MKLSKKEIRTQCMLIGERIRNFLHSSQCREFLFFLFFVFIASTFWVLQALNETYETEIQIPLRVKNVPDDVMVTGELPQYVELLVQDKGTVLVNYKWGQGFVPLVLDFEDFRQRGPHIRILASEFQKKLTGQLAVSTNLLDVNPDTLELIYTQGKAKKVPVRIAGQVSAAKQYYITKRVIKPDTVLVYAPQSILDTLDVVYTKPVHWDDISDSIRRSVPLSPIKGGKLLPSKVDVSVHADIFTEKTVSVPIMGVGFPDNRQLKTFPSKVDVTFQVGMQLFKQVTADDLTIEVYYDDLMREPRSEKCQLKLKTIPVGVSHVRLHPESVEYLIEQTN